MINCLRKPRRLLICMILLLFCMNVHINIYVKILKCNKKRKKRLLHIPKFLQIILTLTKCQEHG